MWPLAEVWSLTVSERPEEIENQQTNTLRELHVMQLIQDTILIETEDRARVQTDREMGETVETIEETTEIEGIVQTGALEVQIDRDSIDKP